MANRRQPFGYEMIAGTVVIHPQESEVVRFIFRQYGIGFSFNDLVEILQDQTVEYVSGKSWNKNMIARILEDNRYIGADGLPPILSEQEMERARRKRAEKQRMSSKTPVQKALCQLCGETVDSHTEQRVLGLLNKMAHHTEQIISPKKFLTTTERESDLKNKLQQILTALPVDERGVYRLIYASAAETYRNIDPMDYETEKIRRVLNQAGQMKRLDADILKATVSEIRFKENNIIIRLKNGQIIKGVEQHGR